MAWAEVFNGKIPGPTIRVNVGETVVVRLINDLSYRLGIHWHGLELANYSDGTEITQSGVPGAPLQTLGNGTPAGGTFLYKFKATRPGLFWYHPHHHNSMNQVFRGLYGLIVVTDPLESNIVPPAMGALLPADTMQLVLSDTTVCKGAGSLDPTYVANYIDPNTLPLADRPEWLSGRIDQFGPTPKELCEIAPGGTATDDDGAAAAASYLAGDIPSLVRAAGRLTEGQTVLTNGVNVGGRLGTPGTPRALDAGALKRPGGRSSQDRGSAFRSSIARRSGISVSVSRKRTAG
jgi:FtsP/CotA-like multicopper oxidase with cupredoxin domain